MKIKSLHIKNFKSIVDLTINEPNPFTVFVGPNGSGKSNIFEALEYRIFKQNLSWSSDENNVLINDIFTNALNFNAIKSIKDIEHQGIVYQTNSTPSIEIVFNNFTLRPWSIGRIGIPTYDKNGNENVFFPFVEQPQFKQFIENHSEIFIGQKKRERMQINSDRKLSTSCDNLEKVLKRLLENPEKREEISEWLELFLPEFDRIEVQKSEFSSNENLLIYQKHYERPFNKELISDGTYNIIALLTAVYQSDEPQFLCIEEPENGLHPKVIKQLVNFFRDACEEKGHYIWLNTHSQTLVSVLEPKEIILVDKVNGETQIKQFDKDFNLHGFVMDEAWLTNALGGGLPW